MISSLALLASYSTDYNDAATQALMASFSVGYYIGVLVLYVLQIIGLWKVFEKAGVPGWYSIIPFLNYYWLTKIATGNGWLFLLILIPCVGTLIWLILVAIKLAPAFGKGGGYIAGFILIPQIMWIVLGFGDAQYYGPQ